eukprot:scaffold4277_cov64-Cyclotella_meneghiniana.AAC.1
MNHQITNHNNYQSNGNITVNNHTTFNHDGGVKATSTGASASSKTASPENDDNKESNAIPPVVRKEVLVDNQKRVILPNLFIPLVKKEITLAYAAEWICYLPFLSTKYEHAHPVYQEEEYKRDMKDIMTAIWDKCYQYGEDALEELVIKNHSGFLYNSKPLTKMEDVAAMYEGKGAEIGLALSKPNYHSQEQGPSKSSKAAKRAKTMREDRWFVPTDWNKFGKGRVYVTVSKDRYAPLSSLLKTPDMKQLRSAVSELELHQCAVRFIDKARSEGKSLDQVLDLVKTYFESENGDCNAPSESPGVEMRGMPELDEFQFFKGLVMSPTFAPSNPNQWMQPHPQMPPHHQHQIPMFQPVQEYNCGPPVSDQYHYHPTQQQQLSNPYQNRQPPRLPPYQNQHPSMPCNHPPQPLFTQPGNISQGDVRSNIHDNHDVQHAPFTQPGNGNNPYDPVPPVNHPSHTPFTQAGNIPSQGFGNQALQNHTHYNNQKALSAQPESEVESEVNPFDIFGNQALRNDHGAASGGNGDITDGIDDTQDDTKDDKQKKSDDEYAVEQIIAKGYTQDDTKDDKQKKSDDEYAVEQIIAKDHVKGKYLIEWFEDYEGEHGEDRYTWEPTNNITDKQLVKSFESTWEDMARGEKRVVIDVCDTRNLGRSNIRQQEQGILNCDRNGVIKLQWKEIKKTKTPAEGTKKPMGVDKTKNQNQQHQYPEHLSG